MLRGTTMKATGIVAEYNPFHNGHKHQLTEARRKTQADVLIIAMSGHFLQRGLPALMDKWVRAESAIRGGADIVVEIPTLYACASAEYFASGAVHLLSHLKISQLSFGSESENIEPLQRAAEILVQEPEPFRERLLEMLKAGSSYAEARAGALAHILGSTSGSLSQPNDILGIEYLKALIRQKTSIVPTTVHRIGADYHSTTLTGSICSATAIRSALEKSDFNPDELKPFMPKSSWNLLNTVFEQNHLITENSFIQLILYRISQFTPADYVHFPDAEEGLWNRLLTAARTACSYQGLVDRTQTRRYPRTRIQRLIASLLLDIRIHDRSRLGLPQYARVLGTSATGRSYLAQIRKDISIPILSNLARHAPQSSEESEMLALDVRATDLYQLGFKNLSSRVSGKDYTTPMPFHLD